MILYQSGMFGMRNLLRVHGSPVYKVVAPTAFSTLFLLFMAYVRYDLEEVRSVQHPYGIGAFIGFFSFLLTFRLNFAYGRYWEGATAVHHMLSKWLDVAMTLAAWHYQAHSYDDVKPPAFGLNPLATPENMPQRPHSVQPSLEYTLGTITQQGAVHGGLYKRFQPRLRRLNELEQQQRTLQRKASKGADFSVRTGAVVKSINRKSVASGIGTNINNRNSSKDNNHYAIPVPSRFLDDKSIQARNKSTQGRPTLATQSRGSVRLTRDPRARMPAPSLFLQELAHLSSLLTAVAMSTLRNDIELAESPLREYIPGEPWPPVRTCVCVRVTAVLCGPCVYTDEGTNDYVDWSFFFSRSIGSHNVKSSLTI
jgi:hypothetical protein